MLIQRILSRYYVSVFTMLTKKNYLVEVGDQMLLVAAELLQNKKKLQQKQKQKQFKDIKQKFEVGFCYKQCLCCGSSCHFAALCVCRLVVYFEVQ